MNCPLCKRQVLTEKYYEDENIWIVRDLHKRQYDFRILAVWKKHKPCNQLEEWEEQDLGLKLRITANSFLPYYEIVNIDKTHFTIPGHCHWQACLRLTKDKAY